MNEANAIVLIGSLYLYLVHNLDVWTTVFLFIFSIAMWSQHVHTDKKKELLNEQVKLTKAKRENLEKK